MGEQNLTDASNSCYTEIIYSLGESLMPFYKILTLIFFVIILNACSTGQVKKVAKVSRSLTGGDVERAQLLEPSVKEALDYEMRVCMDGDVKNIEKRTKCIHLAVEKVRKDKGLNDEIDFGGEVIIRELDENAAVNEDAVDNKKDDEDSKEDDQ